MTSMFKQVIKSNFTINAYATKTILRQKCRTDIFALSAVLGYPDISPKIHGPIVDILPKLLGGEDIYDSKGRYIEYKPYKEIWQMEGPREFLVMYPRGHLKTTLVSQAYLIQCIINWPDIRILLSCGIGDQIQRVVRAIKGIFQYNDDFRTLFPEFCPVNVEDFGSNDQFIVPARKLRRGEPTLFSVTVGKTIAGHHPDMIFHSDLVDKENVKTPGGIKDVIGHFEFMGPLLERYSAKDGYPASRGFVFVEGTPYDFGDLHNKLMKDDKCITCSMPRGSHFGDKLKCKNNSDSTSYSPAWQKVVRPAQENYPHGKILWPERFPQNELDRICRDNEWLFSAQYLMKCVPQGDGLCDPKDVAFLPPHIIGSILPTLRIHSTIDLAGMEENRSGDYTVLTVGGFDRDGRLYIIDIQRGHFPPENVIERIFNIYNKYPFIIDFKIEKDAHTRVLLPFLQREMSKRQKFPVIWPMKRDTHRTKQDRIKSLRPWFKTGIIRFNDLIDTSTKVALLDEIAQFPSQSYGVHDDVLDTLADMMQNRDGDGVISDVIADAPYEEVSKEIMFGQFGRQRGRDRFLGFNEEGIAEWLYGSDAPMKKNESKTGFLN